VAPFHVHDYTIDCGGIHFSSVGGACVNDAVFLEKSIPIKSQHMHIYLERYFITRLQMNIDIEITMTTFKITHLYL